MLNSRSVSELSPPVQVVCLRHVDLLKKDGINLIVISTYRDYAEQDYLYGQGRTRPGAVVTKARAGESWHNFRCAWDAVPLVHGELLWDTKDPTWKVVWKRAREAGAQLGADWLSFPDMDHFQHIPNGMSLSEARQKFDKDGSLW